jgi:small ligand-binding sensory domain FIST
MNVKEKNLATSVLVTGRYDESHIRQAAEQCALEIGGRVSLMIAFVSPDYENQLPELIDLLRVYGRATHVVGCSSHSLIATEQEREDAAGMVLMALHLPRTEIEIRRLRGSPAEIFTAAHDEDDDSLAELPPGIVFFHPLRVDVGQWLDDWNAIFPLTPLLGGLASGDFQKEKIFIFDTKGALSQAHGLWIGLRGGVRIEPLVSQGCRPIGQPQPITESTENIIERLGTRRAYEVLHEAISELLEAGTKVVPGTIHVGLAVSPHFDHYSRGDFLVRHVLAADPQSGRVQIGATAEEGSIMQFQYRDRDSAEQDLRQQAEHLHQRLGQDAVATLLFTCAGRGQAFFGVPHCDAQTLSIALGGPLAGFFSAGEIGPIGPTTHLHGYTASAAVLYSATD